LKNWILAGMVTLGGCIPVVPVPKPGPEVIVGEEEGVERVREAVLRTPVLFHRLEYNPDLPAKMDREIRDLVRVRYGGRYPADGRAADQMVRNIGPAVWRRILETPEGRSAVEAKMRAYWENPKVAEIGDGGIRMDLGVCPGEIVHSIRGGYVIEKHECAVDWELKPAEFVRRVEAMQRSHPRADYYLVDVELETARRTPVRMFYSYMPKEDMVEVSYRDRGPYVTKERIGGLQRVLSGEVSIKTREMETESAQRLRRRRGY